MLHMTAPTGAAPITAAATGPWVPDDTTFGARLALVRQKMGWGNVAEAARECGLERENWRLWEQTGREPRRLVTIAMAIAARTGVDADWLMRGPRKADLLRRAELTLGKLLDLADNGPLPHPALEPRPVKHGDGRLRPIGRPGKARPARPTRTGRRQHRPVSQPAMA